MPQHPYRCIIVGPSGSGKTNLLYNVIDRSKNYNQIYLYAKKLDEPIYEYMIEKFSSVT